jgi:hypothetical protein
LAIYGWLPSVSGELEYGPRGSGGDINVDAGTLSPQGTVQEQLKHNIPGQPLQSVDARRAIHPCSVGACLHIAMIGEPLRVPPS